MTVHERTPATVITGFLGAGKTTLIRNLLAAAHGRRIGLLINEFGDVGIDGEIVKSCGLEACREEDVIELANGCICCTVADDFVPAMSKLVGRPEPLQHIIIETSGLALPQPLVRAFNWPEIRARVTVDAVVTVIDGKALAEGRFASDENALASQRRADPGLEHENPIAELFEDQLNCADLVVLNKTDLLTADEQARIAADLRKRLRPGAHLLAARNGSLDINTLLGLGAAAEDDLASRLSHHEMEGEEQHDHDDFTSFVVELGELPDQQAAMRLLERVLALHDILRLKGFIAIANAPARLLVQAAGPRLDSYFDRPWKSGESRASRLVVIGERHVQRAAVEALLRG